MLSPSPRPERQVAFRTGLSAESRAAALLIAKGFRILARRWKSPVGEIDIVARRRGLLVFVEVKARDTLDDAAWSVTDRQRAASSRPPRPGWRATPTTACATSASTPCWWRRGGCRATSRPPSTRADARSASSRAQLLEELVDLAADARRDLAQVVGHRFHRAGAVARLLWSPHPPARPRSRSRSCVWPRSRRCGRSPAWRRPARSRRPRSRR